MAASCPPTEGSAVLEPFKVRLAAVEYRLRRCLEELARMPPLAPTSDGTEKTVPSSSQWACVRRLGHLANAAAALLDEIAAARTARESAAAVGAEVSEGSPDVASFYADYLVDQHAAVRAHLCEAHVQLERYAALDASFALPLSCVGASAHVLLPSDGLGDGVVVEDSGHSASLRQIPAARVEFVRCDVLGSGLAPQRRQGTGKTPSVTSALSTSAGPNPNGAATTLSAEEAVVHDIKLAVQQMKEGAMHMGELMRGEENALRTSEALMVGGLQKVQQGSRDVDKLTAGTSSRAAPRFVAALPGGNMLWHHALLPLWDVAKQALLLSLVIATTGSAFMLMLVASKPARLRLKK